MRFIKCFLVIVATMILSLSLSACAPKGSVATFSFFNTIIRVETHGTTLSKDTEQKLRGLFSSLQNQFDVNSNDSLIKSFNDAAVGTEFSLSNDATEIFTAAKECYTISNKKFNPAIYPLVKLWGFAPFIYTNDFIPPSAEDIKTTKANCNFDGAEFNALNKTLKKTADIKLDFGGIVKGYAADKATEILNAAGHKKGYVSVGGSSITLLMSQTLSLTHPRKNGEIIKINTNDKYNLSVSTSGDYEKYHLDKDGKRYCHLIDPDSGSPANTGVMSATILGTNGVYGDAFTTALCLKNYNGNGNCELLTFIDLIKTRFPKAEFYIILSDSDGGKILTNKVQGVDFTLLDNDFTVCNI